MVVVVGGGYAGRIAAARVRRGGLPVTLIDPRRATVERTRLHEAAARGTPVEWSLERFADRIGARWIPGAAARVEPGEVVLAGGARVRYDQLILATGSETDDRGVPGVVEHAAVLDTPAQAELLRRSLRPGVRVVVVGAGLTGIELATELAEAGAAVTAIGRRAGWSARAEGIVAAAFERLQIAELDATVTSVEAAGVHTDRGFVAADRVVWAGGLRPARWLREAGLPLAPDGRIRVDEALQVEGCSGVIAAGDCAGAGLRMACATALPMGCHAADAALRLARGEAPAPFRFGYAMRCVSLGRRAGLVQGVDAVDRPTWALGGRPAAVVKEGILRVAARIADWEATSRVSLYAWPAGAVG
ncbi:MAG: FAD-dependent oxidoreductase [Myxococcota bacterium]